MSLSIAIRSTRERMTGLCRKLLEEGFADSPCSLVEQAPFLRALRTSLGLGLELKCKYHLCIDADVLVSVCGIEQLIAALEAQEESVCEAQGLIHDGLLRVWRPAGNHLYRSSALPVLLEILEETDSAIRPEFQLLSAAAKRGLPWLQTSTKIGLHDYAQWQKDCFRKLCFHRLKHPAAFQLAQKRNFWKEPHLGANLEGVTEAPLADFEDYLDASKFEALSLGQHENLGALDEAEEKRLLDRLRALNSMPIDPKIQEVIFPPQKWDRLRTATS